MKFWKVKSHQSFCSLLLFFFNYHEQVSVDICEQISYFKNVYGTLVPSEWRGAAPKHLESGIH